MISFLRGTAAILGTSFVDVDVHGVGYRVHITALWAEQLRSGEEVFIYTHQAVREDAILLYGFPTELDRDWFELLISVSGMGPKGALQILGSISGQDFADAIHRENITVLCALPGVGKKTAQRLVVELKDKLEGFWYGQVAATSGRDLAQPSISTSLQRDVIEALITLGYNEKQALEEVRSVFETNPTLSVEEALRICLRNLSK